MCFHQTNLFIGRGEFKLKQDVKFLLGPTNFLNSMLSPFKGWHCMENHSLMCFPFREQLLSISSSVGSSY